MAYTPKQKRVAYHIYDVGRRRGEADKEILSALETALVEANLSNPAGGHGTSAGWRQEIDTYGSVGKRRNIRGAANRFYDETSAQGNGKGMTPGQLAQAVQRSAYPGRYDEREKQARDLKNWLDKKYGKGGGSKGGTYTTAKEVRKPSLTPGKTTFDKSAFAVDYLLNKDKNKSFAKSYLEARDSGDYDIKTPAKLDKGKVKLGKVKVPDVGKGGGGTGAGKGVGKGGIEEVFHDPLGKYFDSGQVVKGAIGGHGGHVHVSASTSKRAIQLGKMAQRMGLAVREHPHFDPVDPVHTSGSFHYKNQAIDVSGDSAKMRKFAKAVMRRAK